MSLPSASYSESSDDDGDLCSVTDEIPNENYNSVESHNGDDDHSYDNMDNDGLIRVTTDFYRDGDVNRKKYNSTSSSDNNLEVETSNNQSDSKYKNFVRSSRPSKYDDDDDFGGTSMASYGIDGNRKRKLSVTSSDDECTASRPKRSNEFGSKIQKLVTSAKKQVLEDTKGMEIMERMGFRVGQGLGKSGQGRVEPVELSTQRGRRGLGLKLPGLAPEDLHFDSSLEVVNEKENYLWLSCVQGSLGLDTLKSWMEIGPKVLAIDNMTTFVNPDILKHILQAKTVFDGLSAEELLKARSRSNPFETLKNAIFQNRAALKMANMDAVFDFMFTNPQMKDDDDNLIPMVKDDELLYFADVCAGPGGFSEYVLWRKKWRCKGFGFTLKGDCDFKLDNFFAGTPETFETYYGVKGDGDVFDPDNITSLTDIVMKGTDFKGVHFMMADGGFSVDGQENIQELLSKQLYLCQFLVALSIVRNKGHFVCKLFDIFSPFSAGLVYLMHRAFESICLFKPNTSRPANSERYIICKHKRSDCGPIRDYLFEVNLQLIKLQKEDPDSDIVSIVPESLLTSEEEASFYNYLVDSNNSLGERQVISLIKIAAYCRDVKLVETRQGELRSKCLKLWEVPETPRVFDRSSAEDVLKDILPHTAPKILPLKPVKLTIDRTKSASISLEKSFHSVLDWECVGCGTHELSFFLSTGRSKVFRFDINKRAWIKDDKVKAKLNPGTLVYGEVLHELKGERRSGYHIDALHIVDGFSIGYDMIDNLPYKERLKMLSLYCKALERAQEDWNFPVRVKDCYELQNIRDFFEQLTVRYNKQMNPILVIENERFNYQPRAIAFINTTKPPWIKVLSKSTQLPYYFNTLTRRSEYPGFFKENVFANAEESIRRILLWKFEHGVGLQQEPIDESDDVLHKDELLAFVSGS